MILYSIDRFEGNFAVCENLTTHKYVKIPTFLLPLNVRKEGSIIKFKNGIYTLDKKVTNNKQEEVKNMVNNLFKKN